MKQEMEISYCRELFQRFEPIGALKDGGVTNSDCISARMRQEMIMQKIRQEMPI